MLFIESFSWTVLSTEPLLPECRIHLSFCSIRVLINIGCFYSSYIVTIIDINWSLWSFFSHFSIQIILNHLFHMLKLLSCFNRYHLSILITNTHNSYRNIGQIVNHRCFYKVLGLMEAHM